MSDLEAKTRPNIADWQAESLRLTAFLSPSARIEKQDWWKDLTGEEPDSKIHQKTGIQQEEGIFKDEKIDGKLVLIIQPTRIDWHLIPPSLDTPDLEFPTIGSFLDSVDSFLSLILNWLNVAPPIQRLAFGTVLVKAVNNLEEGHEFLSSRLPFNLDKDSSNFFYQINRPRKYTSDEISDLLINRLSKWNVIPLQGLILNLNQPTEYVSVQSQFYVRLELDINTMGDFSTELPSEQLPKIFRELVELGEEITEEGDIK